MPTSVAVVAPVRRRNDLEERTLRFAADVRAFANKFPRSVLTSDDMKQLIRASGSVGANYIEANEAIGPNDFVMRIRICLKESKECSYWLRLLDVGSSDLLEQERDRLVQESRELLRIFFAIQRTIRLRKIALSKK